MYAFASAQDGRMKVISKNMRQRVGVDRRRLGTNEKEFVDMDSELRWEGKEETTDRSHCLEV